MDPPHRGLPSPHTAAPGNGNRIGCRFRWRLSGASGGNASARTAGHTFGFHPKKMSFPGTNGGGPPPSKCACALRSCGRCRAGSAASRLVRLRASPGRCSSSRATRTDRSIRARRRARSCHERSKGQRGGGRCAKRLRRAAVQPPGGCGSARGCDTHPCHRERCPHTNEISTKARHPGKAATVGCDSERRDGLAELLSDPDSRDTRLDHVLLFPNRGATSRFRAGSTFTS